ncbi:MAG: hypothetical protein J6D03_02225 [Clostridia bacterium]|nr:hypothetical protein [Clostridia bacterium]
MQEWVLMIIKELGELVKNISSETAAKLLASDDIVYSDEFMFLLPKEIMQENKSAIIEKITKGMVKDEFLGNDLMLMNFFIILKAEMECGLGTYGIYGNIHDEVGALTGTEKYKMSVTQFKGLEFLKSNFNEISEQMNLECKSFEELEEKYKTTLTKNTLVNEYGFPGENMYGETNKTSDIQGEKEHMKIKSLLQSKGEQTTDLCCFPIAGYEESFFVALTKDESGKEHFRMFNSKGQMLNDTKPEITLGDNGEFIFPENPYEQRITETNSRDEKSINDITFENLNNEVDSKSLCQFVVPAPGDIKGKPGIRYCITKGKDGRIEMKMSNSQLSEEQSLSMGQPVECFRIEELALLKKYEEFGIRNEDLVKSVYGLKQDKSKVIDEQTKEESREEIE